MSAMPIVATIYLGGEVTVIGTNALKPGEEVQIVGDVNIPNGTYLVDDTDGKSFQFNGAGIAARWNQTPSQGMFAPVNLPSTAVVAAAPATSSFGWFTDPTQEIISGIPNIAIVGGAALVLLLLMKKK